MFSTRFASVLTHFTHSVQRRGFLAYLLLPLRD